jgi:hypothetical protein
MKQKSLFLTIAVLLGLRITTIAQTPPSYVPTDGLVGWWPFNGNANDESGNGNNGTVIGATLTEDRFGNANAAYGFDGIDDLIEIGSAVGDFGISDFTISCWVHDTSESNSGVLVAKRGAFGWGNFYELSWDNAPVMEICQENSPTNYNYYINEGSFLNSWNHVVMVRSGQEVRLYLNCELIVAVPTANIQNIDNQDLLAFGGRYNTDFSPSLAELFKGEIDDVGLWERALSDTEILGFCDANLCYEYITVTDTLIINLGPTGFNPVTYSNTILMYPNPSNDQLTIDYGDYATLAGYTLKIFNSIGQEIHSANINQQQEVLPLGTWGGAGNYQVVIYNAQGVPVDTRTIVLQ